jgi:DNA-binding MltR family transcriptional regulator
MASKRKNSPRDLALAALQRLSRERPHINDLWAIVVDAEEKLTSDFAFVLVLAAAVEQALELAISSHFILDEEAAERMFDDQSSGLLGNFAAKIKMGFALGIYEKHVRDELNMIRVIRNVFAHHKGSISFDSEAVTNGCNTLFIPNKWQLVGRDTPQTAKERFYNSARMLYVYLEDPLPPQPKKFATHPFYSALSE